jgi:Tetratricopeptide repeat
VEIGRTEEAILLFERVLAIYRRMQGLDDSRSVDISLQLGGCLSASGRSAEAEPLLRQALFGFISRAERDGGVRSLVPPVLQIYVRCLQDVGLREGEIARRIAAVRRGAPDQL